MDGEAGEAADDRAVDADELEVAADLQLDAPCGVGAVPALDGRGDQVGDLALVVVDDVLDGALDPVVDLRLQLWVGGQAPTDVGQPVGQPAAQLAARVVRRAQHPPFQLAPQRLQPRLDLRVRQQLLFDLLGLGDHHGVVAQPLGEQEHTGLDRLPHLVLRVGADVGEEALHATEDLVEHAVVDRLGHPPRRLLFQPEAHRAAVVVEEPGHAGQHGVEQPLVVSTLDGRVDRLAEQRGDLGRPQPALDESADAFLDGAVVEHLDRAAHGVGDRPGGALGVHRLAEPAPEPLADVDGCQPLRQHFVGEEVALDELTEAAADLVLAVGDDRRVRDGDPQRMPEEGGDGEPVGECADHRRLGAGAHVADPGRGAVLVGPGDQVHDRRSDEHPGGERLHPPEVPLPPDVDRRHRGSGHVATLPVWSFSRELFANSAPSERTRWSSRRLRGATRGRCRRRA